MTIVNAVWNMTPKRLKDLVSEELSGASYDEFLALFGANDKQIQSTLNKHFNDANWMTKQERIEMDFNSLLRSENHKQDMIAIVRIMMKVFKTYQEIDYDRRNSFLEVFWVAGCIRTPGALELWLRSSRQIQTASFNLYNSVHTTFPRAIYAYLLLLEKAQIENHLKAYDEMTSAKYLDNLREVYIDQNTSLDLTDLSAELISTLQENRYFNPFGYVSVQIVTLMHMVYGARVTEAVLMEFVDSELFTYPDEIIKVLDIWEEFSSLPLHWITEHAAIERVYYV